MNENSSTSSAGAALPESQMKAILRRIDTRQWWLSSSAMLVTLLLMVGIASFGLTVLQSQFDNFYSFFLSHIVRGLAGLVLIFNVYVVYEQVQINRLRRQWAEQVYKQAFLDTLTGLFNRGYIEQVLASEIARSQRQAYPLTMILFDLDAFKQVNDRYGHSAGDTVLQAFAEQLKKAIRGSDLAARYGGDEFLAVLPDCRAEGLQDVLKRLNDLQVEMNGEKLAVYYSVGWTDYIPGEPIGEFVKRADMALYVDKRSSRVQPLFEGKAETSRPILRKS
jgi:diguanylate cyclase (GGDEF)-like protein